MKKTVLALACAACGTLSAMTGSELDALIARMTIEEKAGQLTQLKSATDHPDVMMSLDTSGVKLSKMISDWVMHGEVGTLLSACGIENFNVYQRLAVEKSRLKIPLMIGHDMIHGVLTQLPVPVSELAYWTRDRLVQAAGPMHAWIAHDSVSGRLLTFDL